MTEISKDTCKSIDKCLCCGSEELQMILDLGNQPLANSYLKSQNEEEGLKALIVAEEEFMNHMKTN